MDTTLTRNWWAVLLRGVMAVLFGILTLVWPQITLGVLVFLFGLYAALDGVFALVAAVRAAERHQRWGVLVLEGVIGILAALAALFYPGGTAITLLYIIAFWAIVTGIMEIIGAVILRRFIANEWFLILAGALSVLFGIVLIVNPGVGALSVVTIIGAYALIFGISLIALALRLRSGTPTGRTMTPSGV